MIANLHDFIGIYNSFATTSYARSNIEILSFAQQL